LSKQKTLTDSQRLFVEKQPLFFVATAGSEGRVNLSPKGIDSLKIVSENRILWLNLTGSGNETAAHVLETNRMTLMFCAFDGDPMILRAYGTAKIIHPRHQDWAQALSEFPAYAGSRQIFDMAIDLVQVSCGSGVPIMEFKKSRAEEELLPFFEKMGDGGVEKYWRKTNALSIDGNPTGILEE